MICDLLLAGKQREMITSQRTTEKKTRKRRDQGPKMVDGGEEAKKKKNVGNFLSKFSKVQSGCKGIFEIYLFISLFLSNYS